MNGRPALTTPCIAASSSFSAYRVSIQAMSAPPLRRPSACSAKASNASAYVRSPSGSRTSPVGPIDPATTTGRPAAAAARRAISAPARLIAMTWSPKRCRASRYRLAPKVLVRMMSDPATTMAWWTDRDLLRGVQIPSLPACATGEPQVEQVRPHGAVGEEPVAFAQERFEWIHRFIRSDGSGTGSGPRGAGTTSHPMATAVSVDNPARRAGVPAPVEVSR